MQKTKKTLARKRPRQLRSKETVEKILRATQMVMAESGYDNLNTASIADHAGVSVGSVYQYFPNKEAIVRQLADSWLLKIRTLIEQHDNSYSFASREEYRIARREKLMEIALLFRDEIGLLPLLETMSLNSSLREIDAEHDKKVLGELSRQLLQANPDLTRKKAKRAVATIQAIAHAGFRLAATKPALGFGKVAEDTIRAVIAVEERYLQF